MPSLKEVYQHLELGYYVVPEIQREFVWRNPQIVDLVYSIYHGYPIGSICLWEMPNKFFKEYKDLFKPLSDELHKENGRYMVIDGRQRLTSLLLVKRGKLIIDGKQRSLNHLYFNPLDKRFHLARGKRMSTSEDWFSVSEVLKAESVEDLVADLNVSKNLKAVKKGLEKLRDQFKTYEITILNVNWEIKDDDDFLNIFDRVSEMFVMLNTRGTRIKLPDLVLAIFTGKTITQIHEPFRKEFHSVMKKLEEKGYDVDSPPLIRAFLAISTGKIKFREASKEFENINANKALEFLRWTERAIVKTLDECTSIGVRVKFLQSRYLPVVPAVLIHKEFLTKRNIITESFKKDFRKWFILASFDERYTGRLESDLYEDIATINEGKGIKELINNLRRQTLTEEDFSGEWEYKHITLLCALYATNGARDWDFESCDPKEIGKMRDNEITIHHIFPQTLLKNNNIEEELIHDIANITIISVKANEKIKNKRPSEYLRRLVESDETLLQKHFIPIDHNLWNIERYQDFLSERRRLILDAVSKYFEIKIS